MAVLTFDDKGFKLSTMAHSATSPDAVLASLDAECDDHALIFAPSPGLS